MTAARPIYTLSLRTQISLGFGLVALIVSSVLALVMGQISAAVITRDQSRALAALAAHLSTLLDQSMFERAHDIQTLAALDELRNPATPRIRQQALLESLQASYPDYAWIGIADPRGVVQVATGGLLAGVSVADRPWFSSGQRDLYVGDVHEALLLSTLLPHPPGETLRFVDLATPLYDRQGQLSGVLAAHLSWGWADEVQRTVLDQTGQQTQLQVTLLDQAGAALLGAPPRFDQLPARLAAAQRGEITTGELRGVDGVAYLSVLAPTRGYRIYPGLGWSVLVWQSAAVTLAPAYELQQRIFGFGLLLGTLGAGLGWLLAGQLTRPLLRIAAVADQLRHGALNSDFPVERSSAELHTLSTALRELLVSLQTHKGELRASEERFRLLVDSVHDYAIYLLDPAGQIISWNPGAERITGYAADEILGQPVARFYTPEAIAAAAPAHDLAAAATYGRYEEEGWRLRKDGAPFWANMVLAPIRDAAGALRGFAQITRDVTERQRIHEQLERRVAERTAEVWDINDQLVNELELRAQVEQALRASEARYRTISELTSDYVYALRVEPDGQLVKEWVTDAFTSITGYSLDELEAHGGWGVLIYADDLPIAQARAARLFAGEPDVSEFRLRTRDGELRWVRDYARAVRDAAGQITQIIGAVRDITARRLSEQRLAVQHAATEILAAAASLDDAGPTLLATIGPLLGWDVIEIWIYDPALARLTPTVLWSSGQPASQAFVAASSQLSFRPGEGLPGQVWLTCVSCWIEDVTQAANVLRNALAAAAQLHGALGVPIQHQGVVFGTLSGWHREHLRPDPATLTTLEVLGSQIGQFIARTRAAAALQEVTRLQRAILDSASYMIISTDAAGVIRSFNAAAEQLLGYRATELIGKHTPEIFHDPGELAQRAAALSASLGRPIDPGFAVFGANVQNGGVDEAIWTFIRNDGGRFPGQLAVTALCDQSGTITGYLGVGSDITLRQQTEAALVQTKEAAEAADRAKSSFLATMSHEIRTPLNAMIGLTDLLLDSELSPSARDYAATIRSSGDLLLAIINNILDFSKIEAERLDLERVPIDLPALVAEVRGLVLPVRGERPIDLITTIAPDAPRSLLGDPTRLRQILVNLLGNALKFTERGEVVLQVWGAASREPGARNQEPGTNNGDEVVRDAQFMVLFSVRDTGIGIAADQIAQLFEPFTQADASTTRRYQGSGLGLAISRRLAELMGGSLSVVSAPGVGSTFTLALPGALFSASPKLDRAEPARPSEPLIGADRSASHTALRILIVEDNSVNQFVVTQLLRRLGYAAEIANDGQAALTALARQPYDVIFMDVQMPVMDGIEATRQIRAGATGPIRPWIIALTANVRAGAGDQVLAAGMDDYLSKPLRLAQLEAALTRAIHARARLSGGAPSRPAAPAAPSAALLDPTLLYEMSAALGPAGPDFVGDLVRLFADETPPLLEQIRQAIASGALADLIGVVHRLRGSSANMGAHALRLACADLEQAASAADLSACDSLSRQVIALYPLTLEALEGLVGAGEGNDRAMSDAG